MIREVFHHVVDRLQHREAVILHGDMILKPSRRQCANTFACLGNCCPETLHQFEAAYASTGRELRVPPTLVRFTADARKNPLPDIAVQMKTEIADAVFIFLAAHPDLGLFQLAQADLDTVEILPELRHRIVEKRLGEFRSAGHKICSDQFSSTCLTLPVN